MCLNPGATAYHPSESAYISTYPRYFPPPQRGTQMITYTCHFQPRQPGIPHPFRPPFTYNQPFFPPPYPAMQASFPTPFPYKPGFFPPPFPYKPGFFPPPFPYKPGFFPPACTPMPALTTPFPAPSASYGPLPSTPAQPPSSSNTQAPRSSKHMVEWVSEEILGNQHRFLTSDPVWPTDSASKPTDLEFGTIGALIKGRTTIMLKNIPVKFTREMLIQMLDQHCAVHGKDVESAYDFVYIPIDFSTGLARGFAFVNFTTSKAAQKAYEKMHLRKWTVFKTQKIAHVCYACIQGKEALVAHFKYAQFKCHTDEFLPAVFTPPRNGITSLSPPEVISTRY